MFARYVTFPGSDAWSDDTLDHVMAMLYTMLHPFDHFAADQPANGAVQKQATTASNDWEVMEEDGSTMAFGEHTSYLSETDYLSLLEQFPFAALMAYVFRAPGAGAGDAGWRSSSSSQVHTPDTALEVIAFVSSFMQTLATVFGDERRTRHRHLIVHVVRQICQAISLLTEFWLWLRQEYFSLHNWPWGASKLRLQVEYDQILLRCFRALREGKSLASSCCQAWSRVALRLAPFSTRRFSAARFLCPPLSTLRLRLSGLPSGTALPHLIPFGRVFSPILWRLAPPGRRLCALRLPADGLAAARCALHGQPGGPRPHAGG